MMIKKEYIAPSMDVVEMEMVSMFAASEWEYNPGEAPEEELSNRRRNFWEEIGGR
jgi:hypothetical protein